MTDDRAAFTVYGLVVIAAMIAFLAIATERQHDDLSAQLDRIETMIRARTPEPQP